MKWGGVVIAGFLALPGAAEAQAPSPFPLPGKPVPGSFYNEREWLEDDPGHRRAIEMQNRFRVPLLIYFYADWNDDCNYLWDHLLSQSDFKNKTRNVIKLRINPEHGKPEGRLANQYKLRRYPTTIVIDEPHKIPRKIDLIFWSFGKLRTPTVDYAFLEITGAVTNNRPWESKPSAPAETNAAAGTFGP